MIRSLLLIIVAVFLNNANSFSQSTVYALTSHNDILRINPSSCTYDTVIEGYRFNTTDLFIDIAYEQGEMYACGQGLLYKIDLVSGNIYWINLGNGIDPAPNGLASDHNGNLYVSGWNLKKYNIANGTLQDLGALNFVTEGDIDFANNRIYITAEDSLGNGKLLDVELNPFTVSVVDTIPTGIFGMSQFEPSSPNELLISKDSMLLVLDVNTGAISPLCPNIFDNINIYGMTSGPDYLTIPTVKEQNYVNIFQQNQKLSIQLESNIVGQSQYYLYNALGQLVSSSTIINDLTVIDLNEFPLGILFLTVEIPNGSSYQRKIVSY